MTKIRSARAMVLIRCAIAFRIVSQSIDFRQNEEIVEQWEAPSEIIDQCLKATDVLGLRWSGIDLRAASDGALRFLEVNSSPMFLGFDSRGGTDILGALVDRLTAHAQGSSTQR